jgi:hypothetical protein
MIIGGLIVIGAITAGSGIAHFWHNHVLNTKLDALSAKLDKH